MFDRELWGVVADGQKYILRSFDGHNELYDLVVGDERVTLEPEKITALGGRARSR